MTKHMEDIKDGLEQNPVKKLKVVFLTVKTKTMEKNMNKNLLKKHNSHQIQMISSH